MNYADTKATVKESFVYWCQRRFFVVTKRGLVVFHPKQQEYYLFNKEHEPARTADCVPATISTQLTNLFGTQECKAEFGFAPVEPCHFSVAALASDDWSSSFFNVNNFCRENKYFEPLYVYTVWDKTTYYELEPHALVREKHTRKVRDVTACCNNTAGVREVRFVHHPTLEKCLAFALQWRIQYSFAVVKANQ